MPAEALLDESFIMIINILFAARLMPLVSRVISPNLVTIWHNSKRLPSWTSGAFLALSILYVGDLNDVDVDERHYQPRSAGSM